MRRTMLAPIRPRPIIPSCILASRFSVTPGHECIVYDVSADELRRIWRYELRPYLAEFWFEQHARLQDLERAVSELLSEAT